jgi:four helix bundle protein
MDSDIDALRERTKAFAFKIIEFVKGLERNIATDAIARQLIRSGTAICANHRAAGRARSRREFIAKLATVVEEADETELWLEALLKCRLAAAAIVQPLYREAVELRAIFVQSLRTARRRAAQAQASVVVLGVVSTLIVAGQLLDSSSLFLSFSVSQFL